MGMIGKTVLITGAGSGLGAAIARQMLGTGANLVLLDRAGDRVRDLAGLIDPAGGKTLALGMDIRDRAAVTAALARAMECFGGLDVLVNNAGTDVTASLQDVDVQAWEDVLDTNLRSVFLLCKGALAHLRAADGGQGGHIVNIASTAAVRAWPNASAYHASKWGLLGLSRALHAELRPVGVRVSTVIAGGMRTPFLLDRFPELDPAKLQDPCNVASAVEFLLAMPRGSVVAEITVLPEQETSWP
jgi:NAD(P)-dependent dehydrogenase (short-subunit alcohol dehydrogenase family)